MGAFARRSLYIDVSERLNRLSYSMTEANTGEVNRAMVVPLMGVTMVDPVVNKRCNVTISPQTSSRFCLAPFFLGEETRPTLETSIDAMSVPRQSQSPTI